MMLISCYKRNITKNVKTSTMFNETEHLIKEMFENIDKIRQNRETNSSSVKEQKRIISWYDLVIASMNCGIQCILYKDLPHILDTELAMA
jgi:hypothetical protein